MYHEFHLFKLEIARPMLPHLVELISGCGGGCVGLFVGMRSVRGRDGGRVAGGGGRRGGECRGAGGFV